jgi:hypothetical protein
MVESASLTLLKNAGKAKAVDKELEKQKPAPPPPSAETPADDEVTVDVDTMSSAELDGLVSEQELTVPDEWTQWQAEAKREWLKKTFGEVEYDVGEKIEVMSDTDPDEPPKSIAELAEQAGEPQAVAADADSNAGSTQSDVPAVQPSPKEKKKGGSKKSKSTAVSTEVAKDGEIVAADLLQDLVHEIENMKEPQAVKLIADLMEQTEVATFRIGGLLSLVQANGWFQPFSSLREFVETKYGIGYRKAVYWIEIYNRLSNASIPWAKVKDVGWTKLQIIAAVLTQENVDEWVVIAGQQNVVTLVETVKNAKAKNSQTSITGETSKTVTTMSFKVHSDQKATIEAAIDKAKGQSGTDVGTVALEFICIEFMGGNTLAERMKKAGVENALKALEQAFPGMNFDVSMADQDEAAA